MNAHRRALRRTAGFAACILLVALGVAIEVDLATAAAPRAAREHAPPATGGRGPDAHALAALHKAPYLICPGGPTTMQVLWQANATGPGTIEWGTDATYSLGSAQTAEYGSDHQHAYTLTGLAPGQDYLYRVTFGGTPHTGSFRAGPAPRTRRLEFFAYGDTRTNVAVHDAIAGQMLAAAAADPERRSLVLSVGDLVSDGNSEAAWDAEFFSAAYPNIRGMLASMPYVSCIGNHEGAGLLFAKYFPYPFSGARYWSFDAGPAHFVIVDQYTSYAPGSPQLTWIANDLAATTLPWRIIVLHEPGWSAGGGHANSIEVQQRLQPLCVQYGVAIVFGGHNHYYARAVVDGVQHVTTGGGGAPLHTPQPEFPSVVATAQSNHYCRITIDGASLGFAAVNGTAVLDTFTLNQPTAVAPAAPPAPVVLRGVYPNPFNPGTTLAFSLAVSQPVRLVIHDLTGRVVATLADGDFTAGEHRVSWDGSDANGTPAASGTYVARLRAGSAVIGRKLVLLR